MTTAPQKLPQTLTETLKQEAHRLGFDLVGACPAVSPPGVEHFRNWLSQGYAGEMHYLADRAEAYEHPRHVLDGARSLLMLAMNYRTDEPIRVPSGSGRVARYAWGADYHDTIHGKLKSLCRLHRELVPEAKVRGVVDTAPLLEREFAQMAGLGWIGKNTLLLNRQLGSWFFLAALLTSEELDYDAPIESGHCGTCRACIDACPTGALVDAYRLDATRCISYLTIELRSAVPEELRALAGPWLFGCDECQDVCPWNRQTPVSEMETFRPASGTNPVELAELFEWDDDMFRQRFRRSPFWRARRRGLLRNAAIALGNRPLEAAIPGLMLGLCDPEPLVRGASAWALGRCGTSDVQQALSRRLVEENEPEVRREIEAAIDRDHSNRR